MVPFSYYQVQLNSRGMKKHSSTFEVWTQGVWRLKLGVFALSCLLAFLIVIPAPAFWLYSVPRCSVANPPSCLPVVQKPQF